MVFLALYVALVAFLGPRRVDSATVWVHSARAGMRKKIILSVVKRLGCMPRELGEGKFAVKRRGSGGRR